MSQTRYTKEMREFMDILKANGYVLVRSKGSHFVFEHSRTHNTISVNKDLNKMVRQRLIKENNLYSHES